MLNTEKERDIMHSELDSDILEDATLLLFT